MKSATKKVIQNPMRPAVKVLDERQNTIANNQLTESQLLFRLQDFCGAEQDAAKIGDHEYAMECADIVCVIREVLERRKADSDEPVMYQARIWDPAYDEWDPWAECDVNAFEVFSQEAEQGEGIEVRKLYAVPQAPVVTNDRFLGQ
ncbi:hypothetical protein NLN82_26935 [Citrobacter portucalensis]|uniref:hypothetical protein n=1 Tax=Citrobacter portucalensis TaxID=1639133 RepID=UPI00226B6FA7|nr:hypothetical protein [Citrobacter portucalensis]MCX9039636.1 hypothetical protein [Citrobacter portucalensis]